MSIIGLIIGIVIGAVISGIVIWIVGRLGLGLEVDGFGAAFLAAIVIAIVSGVITWLLSLVGISIGSGIVGGIVHLIIAAVVLMISDRFISGMRVKGFTGALVAAIAMGVIVWLASLVLGLLGLA